MSKLEKIATATIVLVVVIGGVLGYLIFNKPYLILKNYAESTPSSNSSGNKDMVEKAKPDMEVTYGESGFIPSEIKVRRGQTVLFVNNRQARPMYVASNPHPIHTDYKEFEAGVVLGRFPGIGENFSFTFDKPGTWNYHDHADSSKTGTVIVE